MGEYDFKMDLQVVQLHLKITPPLCNIKVQSVTEGVEISCGSVPWTSPLEIDTPFVKSWVWNFKWFAFVHMIKCVFL